MDIYYVYQHIRPDTGEIVYIGSGTYDRAWMSRGGNRSKEHFEFIREMSDNGYTLNEIVEIRRQRLSKKEALSIERELIDKYRPMYNKLSNKSHWQKNRKFEVETCMLAKALHKMGYGYQRIAFLLGSPNYKNNAMSTRRMVSYVNE